MNTQLSRHRAVFSSALCVMSEDPVTVCSFYRSRLFSRNKIFLTVLVKITKEVDRIRFSLKIAA